MDANFDRSIIPTGDSRTVSSRGTRILACALCQQRKIKCDRRTPCSNCLKAKIACEPSTPAPARKRKRPNQDLQKRLANCELLIQQLGGATDSDGNVSPGKDRREGVNGEVTTLPPSSGADSRDRDGLCQNVLHYTPAGKVVAENGSVKFMESHLWASIHDEFKAMREIIESEEMKDDHMATDADTPDDIIDLFQGLSSAPENASVQDYQPNPLHVFRLWQVFLDRVNPLTKIVHVPSLQVHLVTAATNASSLPIRLQALFFSINTMAVVAMTEAECQKDLNMSRDEAFAKFIAGTRVVLSRTNFLRSYDMTTIQAMILYLICITGCYDHDAAWVLNGVIFRIAQRLGYHRDGEKLGLTPFETEMQRRIWWQIVLQDARLAMQSGLSLFHLPSTWDTKQPSNLNDADIFPGSTEPVTPREGPTEMVMCLLLYRLGQLLLRNNWCQVYESALAGIKLQTEDGAAFKHDELIAKCSEMLTAVETELKDGEQKYVDLSAGPAHVMAGLFRHMMVDKFKQIERVFYGVSEWGLEVPSSKDYLLTLVVMSMHSQASFYPALAQLGFQWHSMTSFQPELFTVMLGQLERRPVGFISDKGWEVVDTTYHYHTDLHNMSHRNYAQLGLFALRAWRAREVALLAMGRPAPVPESVTLLRELMPAGIEARLTPSSDGSGSGSGSGNGVGGGGGSGTRSGSGSGSGSVTGPMQQPNSEYEKSDDSSMDGPGSLAAQISSSGLDSTSSSPATMARLGECDKVILGDPNLQVPLGQSWESMSGLGWDAWGNVGMDPMANYGLNLESMPSPPPIFPAATDQQKKPSSSVGFQW